MVASSKIIDIKKLKKIKPVKEFKKVNDNDIPFVETFDIKDIESNFDNKSNKIDNSNDISNNTNEEYKDFFEIMEKICNYNNNNNILDFQNNTYLEPINVARFDYIINNINDFQDIIEKEEVCMRRDKNFNYRTNLLNIRNSVIIPDDFKNTRYGFIPVSYKTSKNSKISSGRVYAEKSLGLQPLNSFIRGSICIGLWYDIDQINSHPTFLYNEMKKNNISIPPLLEECINDRNNFLKKIATEEICSISEAKTKIISIINGENNKNNKSILLNFKKQIKNPIDIIVNLPENKYILTEISKTKKYNIYGSCISHILQRLESNYLKENVRFCYEKKLIPSYKGSFIISLIFDGFQVIKNPLIDNNFIKDCFEYSNKNLNIDMKLKIKDFENTLNIPNSYFELYLENCKKQIDEINQADDDKDDNEEDVENLLNSNDCLLNNRDFFISIYKKYIYNKYDNLTQKDEDFIIDDLILKFKKLIYDKGSDLSFANFICIFLKNKLILKKTKECEIFYVLDNLNKWTIDKDFSYLNSFMNDILIDILNEYCIYISSVAKSTKNTLYNKIKKQLRKIYLSIQSTSKSNSIKMKIKEKIQNNEKVDLFDENPLLFSFNNKLIDFTNPNEPFIRDIRSTDNICINTKYDLSDRNKCIQYFDFIDKYLSSLFNDFDTLEFLKYKLSKILIGLDSDQHYNFFTGEGSNGKSYLIEILHLILGDYFIELKPQSLSYELKTGMEFTEFIKTKGKRMVAIVESTDNISTLNIKTYGDGRGIKTITARDVGDKSKTFINQFQIYQCFNTTPTIDKYENTSILRRILTFLFENCFVDENVYDPNNQNDKIKIKDKSIIDKIMISSDIKSAFIYYLLDVYKKYVNNPPPITENIMMSNREFMDNSNIIKDYVEKYYIYEPDYLISKSIFYEHYKNNHNKYINNKIKNNIINCLKSLGVIEHKKSGVRMFKGIKPNNSYSWDCIKQDIEDDE